MNALAHLPARHQQQVWRAHELARPSATHSSGFAALDAVLPGGGWPSSGLVELLSSQPHTPDWGLLLPSLVAQLEPPTHAKAPAIKHAVNAYTPNPYAVNKHAVIVGAPANGLMPFAPALSAQGLPASALLWLALDAVPERLWATEQALACADVQVVVAWLPVLPSPNLRRLHLHASSHGKPLFVFSPYSQRASPAPLRLRLEPDGQTQGRRVYILKRRGPPITTAIELPLSPGLLAQTLAAGASLSLGVGAKPAPAAPQPSSWQSVYALDSA